ncbi:hypothetical protein KAR91_73815 [Candidatus Pacearchaeota archaeon]|nr:hypothetical protein [Candidatus Pacearchaeota archaeon]
MNTIIIEDEATQIKEFQLGNTVKETGLKFEDPVIKPVVRDVMGVWVHRETKKATVWAKC